MFFKPQSRLQRGAAVEVLKRFDSVGRDGMLGFRDMGVNAVRAVGFGLCLGNNVLTEAGGEFSESGFVHKIILFVNLEKFCSIKWWRIGGYIRAFRTGASYDNF